jgi:hypothetical protein
MTGAVFHFSFKLSFFSGLVTKLRLKPPSDAPAVTANLRY